MKPLKTLATSGKWTLRQRDNEFMVQADGKILMTSRRHGSEEILAQVGCARINADKPRVLVGGLGFGFTLRAALDVLPHVAEVTVCELIPAVVDWNRDSQLADMNGHALDDDRVQLELGDIQRTLSNNRGTYDAILIDIDNGPFAVSTQDNATLYSIGGMSSVRASLRSGGRLAVWSAGQHPGFNKRLREVGFQTSVEKTGDGQHLIFIGDI